MKCPKKHLKDDISNIKKWGISGWIKLIFTKKVKYYVTQSMFKNRFVVDQNTGSLIGSKHVSSLLAQNDGPV